MVSEKTNFLRYTNEEKSILYSLYKQYEEIIDIKRRKNWKGKKNFDVRRCWEEITNEYNSNPNITTQRNQKQLQKFWLNSRLRKSYPSTSTSSDIQNTTLKQDPYEREIEFEIQEEIKGTASGDENVSSDQLSTIDRLSPDKLTLSDLLEFKTNTKPHISRHISDGTETIAQMPNTDEQSEHIVISAATSADISVPTCCMHQQHTSKSTDDIINYWKTKEAELRYKEEQIKFQQMQLELTKTREAIKQSRELHQLQLEEMRLKVKILAEQEKKLRSREK